MCIRAIDRNWSDILKELQGEVQELSRPLIQSFLKVPSSKSKQRTLNAIMILLLGDMNLFELSEEQRVQLEGMINDSIGSQKKEENQTPNKDEL